MLYFIERTIGAQSDTLSALWEGNDLPSFARNGRPYCFRCIATAERVLERLRAKYPTTIDTPRSPSVPIIYTIESVDTSREYECVPPQHLGMFL